MWQHLRDGLRALARTPDLSLTTIGTLAVGISAATAMFGMVDGVLLRPLPVRDQNALAVVWREPRGSSGTHAPFRASDIESLAAHSHTLAGVAGVGWRGASPLPITDNGETSTLRIAYVTGSFFGVLDSRPAAGRSLTPADDSPGSAPAIVISHGTWQRRYGGDPRAVGRRLRIGERSFAIVGVAPPGLDYPAGTDAWTTVAAMASIAPNETFQGAIRSELDAITRLRAGFSADQAQAELRTLTKTLSASTFGQLADLVPASEPFEAAVAGDTRQPLVLLFAAVMLVLLIATANAATLRLLHAQERQPELALRVALGANPLRLAASLVAESAVLAGAAGLASLVMSAVLLPAMIANAPTGIPRLEMVHLDWRTGAFAAGASLAAAGLAGVAPLVAIVFGVRPLGSRAQQSARPSLVRGRRALVVAQLALAVAVAIVTSLLARSVSRLQAVDTGIGSGNVVFASLSMPAALTSDRTRHLRFLDDAVRRLTADPRIEAATPINVLPFSGVGWEVPAFTAEGQDIARAQANPALDLEAVHPGYFETLRIAVRGRPFSAIDRQGAVPVAIVSEDLARRTWPGMEPIGRRLKMGPANADGPWLTVVGVARPTRYRMLQTQRPILYVPAEQLIVAAQALAVRARVPDEDTAAAIREAVRSTDPAVDVMGLTPLDELRQRPVARPRLTAELAGGFGLLALSLSAVGVFAVAAVSVRERRRELVIRAALGASPREMRGLVLGEGWRLAATGTAIGVVLAIAAAQSIRPLLFDVSPLDLAAFGGSVALLLLTALAASALPAWWAARTDPIEALRAE